MNRDDPPAPPVDELGSLRAAVDGVQRELEAAEQSLRSAGVVSSSVGEAMETMRVDVTVLKKELMFLTERLEALRKEQGA